MKKKQVLYTSLAALALAGVAAPVYAEETGAGVSTGAVAMETSSAPSSVAVTDLAGTWTNGAGQTVDISSDGLITGDMNYRLAAPAFEEQGSPYVGPWGQALEATDGSALRTPVGMIYLPEGVAATDYSARADNTDTSQERFVIGSQSGIDLFAIEELAYYRQETTANSEVTPVEETVPAEATTPESEMATGLAKGDFSGVAGVWSQQTGDNPTTITISDNGDFVTSHDVRGRVDSTGKFVDVTNHNYSGALPDRFIFKNEEVKSGLQHEGIIEIAEEDYIFPESNMGVLSAQSYAGRKALGFYRVSAAPATELSSTEVTPEPATDTSSMETTSSPLTETSTDVLDINADGINDFRESKGTATTLQSLPAYDHPDPYAAKEVFRHEKGETINFDHTGIYAGYEWVSYVSSSGTRHFVQWANFDLVSKSIFLDMTFTDETQSDGGQSIPVESDQPTNVEVTTSSPSPTAVYAEVIAAIGQNFPSSTGSQDLAGHLLSDIDGNGTPELLVGASANGFAAVYTLVDGKPHLVAQTAHDNPRGGVGVTSTGEIVHTEVNPGSGQYETVIYGLRQDNSGVDQLNSQSGRVGDGQTNIAAKFTLVKAGDLLPWVEESSTPNTEQGQPTENRPATEPTSSSEAPAPSAQPSSNKPAPSTLSSSEKATPSSASTDKVKTSTAPASAKQDTTSPSSSAPSQSLSRVEAAKQVKPKVQLPSTGEAMSLLGLVGLGSLGLATFLKRRQK